MSYDRPPQRTYPPSEETGRPMNAQEAVAVLRGVQEHQGLYIDVRTAIQVLCDEIERLRAELATARRAVETDAQNYRAMQAECERLRAIIAVDHDDGGRIDGLVAERDQANRLVGSLTNELRSVQDRLDAGELGTADCGHCPDCEALAEYERLKAGQ